MMYAELEALICSGPRRGKQFTYALLAERAPQAKTMPRDEALAELTRRYFTSRGPATVKDFVWWSGLTTADAKIGLDMLGSEAIQEVLDGETYWLTTSTPGAGEIAPPVAHLLPAYDEYTIAYKDRSAAISPQDAARFASTNGVPFYYATAINGRIVGGWRRTFGKGTVIVEAELFAPLNDAENDAYESALRRYGEFLGMPVVMA